MKKRLILLIGIIMISATSICNASWWYDFIHSDHEYEPTSCWSCGGTGSCSSCGGTGYTEAYDYENESYYEEICSDCGGSGSCSSCEGSGYY